MRSVIQNIALLAWALWFGAIVALFIFVLTLFHNNRDIAVQAAPQLFTAYERYHLILAGIALLSTVLWRITSRSKLVLVNFLLLAIATCCGVAVAVWIIGPMNSLREQGLSGGEEFKRLHGRSMILFTAQVAMLLIHGIILPFAIRGDAGKSARIAPGSDSPA